MAVAMPMPQDNLILFSWAKQNPGYRVLEENSAPKHRLPRR
jgi:hypothetical protein